MNPASQIKKGITDQRGHIKKPSLAFIICLAISALMWCIVTLSRQYTVTYDYKVACIDLPAGKTKANVSSDATIRLTFKAKGFFFLNPDFSDKNRVVSISVKQLVKHKGENLNSYQFTQTEIAEYLRDSGAFSEELMGMESPNTLAIYLSK